jgi:hypothetical protein
MKKILAILAMLALVAGCGGGMIEGNTEGQDGYDFTLRGAAATDSHALDELGDYVELSAIYLDAGDNTTGSGDGSVDSIADTAESTCAFSTNDSSGLSHIDFDTDNATCDAGSEDCTNWIGCAYSGGTASDDPCLITCNGHIASNSVNANDTLVFDLTFTHDFTTEMNDAGGMVRMGGNVEAIYAAYGLTIGDLQKTLDDNLSTTVGESALNATMGDETIDGSLNDGIWDADYVFDSSPGGVEGTPADVQVVNVIPFTLTIPDLGDLDEASANEALNMDFGTVMGEASICDTQDICDLPSGNE